MQAKWGSRVAIYCVNVNDGADLVRKWWKEQGFPMPVVVQPQGQVSRAFGVHTLATNCVVGPDGVVRYYSVGYDEAAILRAVEQSLAGAP